MRLSRYTPRPGDRLSVRLDKAWLCGRELRPDDRRARWIFDEPDEQTRELLKDAHREGAQDFRLERWW